MDSTTTSSVFNASLLAFNLITANSNGNGSTGSSSIIGNVSSSSIGNSSYHHHNPLAMVGENSGAESIQPSPTTTVEPLPRKWYPSHKNLTAQNKLMDVASWLLHNQSSHNKIHSFPNGLPFLTGGGAADDFHNIVAEQLDAPPTIASNITKFLTLVEKKPEQIPLLKLIHDYLLVILLITVMFSMGCGVTLKEVWNHLRRPTAVMVCLMAQFCLVPFIGYLIISLLELDVLHATGLLILACCPGGVTSNIFTFLADGDLPLSITMTSVATIAAMVLMPLNVWLYGRNLETDHLVIPYVKMSLTLITITIPVVLGMVLNWCMPRLTPYITKIGVFAGFGIICFCQTLEVLIFPDIFLGVPYKLYTAVILFPAFSFVAGCGFAKLFRLNDKICRTIGIEIGIKNVGSALTIISLSFTMQHLKKAWVFPFLYAFSSFLVIFITTIGFKLSQKLKTIQATSHFDALEQDEKSNDSEDHIEQNYKKKPQLEQMIRDENCNSILADGEMNVLKESLLNQKA